MAWTLNISDDSGTVNLNGSVTSTTGSIELNNYTPVIAAASDEGVIDVVRLQFIGTSQAALGSMIQAVNNKLRLAAEYQERRAGSKVYLNYQPDGYSEAYRSEIIGMDADISRLEIEDPYMFNWGTNKTAFANLYVKRRNFWEGTLTPVTLSNPNGTNSTGVVVFNSNQGGTATGGSIYNYTDVAATAIAGDLPSPMKIEFYYGVSNAATLSASSFYILNNTSFPTVSYWQEIATASYSYSSGTASIATASGGTRIIGTLDSTSSSYYTYFNGGTAYNAFGGAMCKIFTSLNFLGTLKVQPISLYGQDQQTGAWNIITQAQAEGAQQIYEVGDIRVPTRFKSGTAYDLDSFEVGYNIQAISGTVGFIADYGMIVPYNYYAKIYNVILGTARGALYLDSIEQNAYYYRGTALNYYSDLTYTGDIMAVPNTAQRLVYKWDCYTAPTASHDFLTAYGSVKAYYRPRRLAL
jgi:hypothetical protein